MSRSNEILTAFGDAIVDGSRWPRLLNALDLEDVKGWPGPRVLNEALKARGFRPVVDEMLALNNLLDAYPDTWWFAIAEEVVGHRDAAVQAVVDAVKAKAAAHAAQ